MPVKDSHLSRIHPSSSVPGRNLGETVTNYAAGWGDYAKDSANYVKDATNGHGSRGGTASNPLGLGRSQSASLQYGMGRAPTYSPAKNALPAPKKPTSGVPVGSKKPNSSALSGAKKPLPAAAPQKQLPAPKSASSPPNRGKGVTRGGAAPARGASKAAAPSKPPAQAPKPAAARGGASNARGRAGGAVGRTLVKK